MYSRREIERCGFADKAVVQTPPSTPPIFPPDGVRPLTLDAGCGQNVEFNDYSTTSRLHLNHGFDVSVDIRLPVTGVGNFIQASILCLPFREDSFETAYISHVLDHLANPGDVFVSRRELCRASGKAVAVFPGFFYIGWTDHRLVFIRKTFVKLPRLLKYVFFIPLRMLLLGNRYVRWLFRKLGATSEHSFTFQQTEPNGA